MFINYIYSYICNIFQIHLKIALSNNETHVEFPPVFPTSLLSIYHKRKTLSITPYSREPNHPMSSSTTSSYTHVRIKIQFPPKRTTCIIFPRKISFGNVRGRTARNALTVRRYYERDNLLFVHISVLLFNDIAPEKRERENA